MKVVISALAQKHLTELIQFELRYFGRNKAADLHRKFRLGRKQLSSFPYSGPKESLLADSGLCFRSLTVDALCKIIYYIDDSVVIIVDVWDTRKEPASLSNGL